MPTIQSADQNSGNARGVSGLSRGFPLHQTNIGLSTGIFVDQDFNQFSAASAGFVNGFEVRGAAITGAGEAGGGGLFTTGTTAFNTAGICSGSIATDISSSISFASTDPRWAFETRVKINRTTAFSLLAGACLAGGDFDALLNGSGVVDHTEEDNFCLYYTAGGDLKADAKYVTDAPALASLGSGLGDALVADTYIKLGLRYSPSINNGTLEYLVNGEVVALMDRSTLASLPAGGNLKFYVLGQTASTTALAMTVDRFSFYSDVN